MDSAWNCVRHGMEKNAKEEVEKNTKAAFGKMTTIDMLKATKVGLKEMKTLQYLAININECEELNEDDEKENDIEIDMGKILKKLLIKKAKEETIKKLLQDTTKQHEILIHGFNRLSLEKHVLEPIMVLCI